MYDNLPPVIIEGQLPAKRSSVPTTASQPTPSPAPTQVLKPPAAGLQPPSLAPQPTPAAEIQARSPASQVSFPIPASGPAPAAQTPADDVLAAAPASVPAAQAATDSVPAAVSAPAPKAAKSTVRSLGTIALQTSAQVPVVAPVPAPARVPVQDPASVPQAPPAAAPVPAQALAPAAQGPAVAPAPVAVPAQASATVAQAPSADTAASSASAPATPAAPPAEPFTVSDVNIDVTADTAAHARDKALVAAERSAYTQICGRMGVPDNGEKLSDDAIAALVQSFEVQSERVSSVRYIGLFTVRFNPVAVKKKLALPAAPLPSVGETKAVPKAAMQAIPLGHVTTIVKTDDLTAWARMKKKLGGVSTVVKVDTLDVEKGLIHVDLAYSGSVDDLKQGLAAQGLALRQGDWGFELSDATPSTR